MPRSSRGVPALGADPAVAAELSASTRGNVRRFSTVARRAAEPPPPDVPPEALDIARTLVRRGVESDALYTAYGLGQQVAWQHWMACAAAVVESRQELVAVLKTSSRLMFEYGDMVLANVIAEMQREAVLGGALARRTETIRLILDGAPLDRDTASRRLGYDLARHHTAIVLWAEPPGVPEGSLESAAAALARAAGARSPLSLPAGTTALWAWIATSTHVATAELRAALADADVNLRAAIGPTARGMSGFRSSHEAAVSVHRLLAGNREGGRVASYDELEVTALAAQDRDRATEFITVTLGPLADDTTTAARLRETLRVFLEEADHAPRAAARLHTHRNTILQRVARATELLGYQPSERRLAVELALELQRWLGPRQPNNNSNRQADPLRNRSS
jgi:DNA-binding PucR family transcriptional regulator